MEEREGPVKQGTAKEEREGSFFFKKGRRARRERNAFLNIKLIYAYKNEHGLK